MNDWMNHEAVYRTAPGTPGLLMMPKPRCSEFRSKFGVFCSITPNSEQWWANIIKWTRTNILIYSHATLCTEWISEYIRMQHIYRTNIQIYLYSGNSTNTNTNNIWGSFYSNIRILVLITDWRNFFKALTIVFL